MKFSAGDWCHSLDYDEPCRLIGVDALWGEQTAQVWLARRAACCDAHPCDERERGEVVRTIPGSYSSRRISTPVSHPPSIVLRAREHCLACRAVAAGVVPAISVVEQQRHTYQIVFFCGEDHGCPSCGCVEAAHNPKTTFRGDRDDIIPRVHVPAGAVRTLGPCSRCECAGGTYDLGDVGPIRGQPLP